MGKIIDTWLEFMKPRMYGRGNGRTYAKAILDDLCRIRSFCNEYSTCDGCPFFKKHKGCIFRGKSPREW